MHYEVKMVRDDQLPAETGWAIVRTPAETYLFVKACYFTAGPGRLTAVMVAAYAAYQASGAADLLSLIG